MLELPPSKVEENRVRRMADRQGLTLVKSRLRDPFARETGTYGLVRKVGADDRIVVAGDRVTGVGLSLKDVEKVLTDQRPVRVIGPDHRDPGTVQFGEDNTPIVSWLHEINAWYLFYLDDDGNTVDYALAGPADDEQFAVTQARRMLDSFDQEQISRPDPLAIYHSAVGYFITAMRADESIEIAPGTYEQPRQPTAMNASFASELFIKSILVIDNPVIVKSHDLKVLWALLDQEHRDQVSALYSRYRFLTIEDDLDEAHDYFRIMRYWFEVRNRHGYDPNAALRIADCLYRHAAKVHGQVARYREFGQ